MISVVVTVYNLEKYIAQCIESILCQTYLDFELILIDDGSEDSSSMICNQYAKRDSRIRVIHQKNRGASAAKNMGIESAKGEYICFVDGDDRIYSTLLAEQYDIMHKNHLIDICIGSYIIDDGSAGVDDVQDDNNISPVFLNKEQAIKELLVQKLWTYSLSAKLYKRSLFENIRCKEALIYSEDLVANVEIFSRVRTVCYLPTNKYIYIMRNASLTHQPFSKRYLTCLDAWMFAIRILDDESVRMIALDNLIKSFLRYALTMLLNEEYRDAFNDYIDRIRQILQALGGGYSDISMKEKMDSFLRGYDFGRSILINEYNKVVNLLQTVNKKYKFVYIYGAGKVGKELAEIAIKERVGFNAFIVSNSVKIFEEVIYEHKVKHLVDIPMEDDVVVIVSTLDKYTNAINDELKKFDCKNIYYINSLENKFICNTIMSL